MNTDTHTATVHEHKHTPCFSVYYTHKHTFFNKNTLVIFSKAKASVLVQHPGVLTLIDNSTKVRDNKQCI